MMRAKVRVQSVEKVGENQERLTMAPVSDTAFGPEGESEDNTFAKWTPSGSIVLEITNPALHGKFEPEQKYYVDFTPAK